MPKCFLVTGGAGFIGSNFVEHILGTQPGVLRDNRRRPDIRGFAREPRIRKGRFSPSIRASRHS